MLQFNSLTVHVLLTNCQSLARAVYSRAATLVIDDVFSGLDNRSVLAISSRLLAADGHFKESGRTVILVTHNHRLLPFADEIVILDSGRITRTGTYDQISSILPEEKTNVVNEDSFNGDGAVIGMATPINTISKITNSTEEDGADANTTRRQGKWSVYGYYFQNSGKTLTALLILAILIAALTDKFASTNVLSLCVSQQLTA